MLQATLLFLVKAYQKTFSPDHGVFSFLGGACRYYPSCSEYCKGAIQKYGALQGMWRAFQRLSRCHPWGGSGVDLP